MLLLLFGSYPLRLCIKNVVTLMWQMMVWTFWKICCYINNVGKMFQIIVTNVCQRVWSHIVTEMMMLRCYEVEATKWCQIKRLPSQSYVWHHAETLDFTGFLETMVASISEILANVTLFWLHFCYVLSLTNICINMITKTYVNNECHNENWNVNVTKYL